jgi:2-polyprenyl-3-methyl-5-hydroxy-6-metoxy-1,4-benzoquinol methylase
MRREVDLVVLTNLPKDLGPDVRVKVGLPNNDPHCLPFAHKRVLADGADQYDLFIYTEDDILISERNIDAFLRATEILPENEIAGFVHAESDQEGNVFYDPPHAHFHWAPDSVCARGEYTFAYYTNEHSACYILTQKQLKRAIASGRYLVEPYVGRYNLACSASTDPYTQCGFKKLVCVSHLDDFTVRHLPANKWEERPYRAAAEFHRQIQALMALPGNSRPRELLFQPETKLVIGRWSKDYYEPCRHDLLGHLPSDARSVLSIGCGYGSTEEELVKKGIRVAGIPMDSVIASCAEAKGVEIVYGDFKTVREKLAGERFDCILFSNVLHLVRDPHSVLSSFAELLATKGVVIASVPNLVHLPTMLRRLLRHSHYKDIGTYERAGLHAANERMVRRWFEQSRLMIEKWVRVVPQEYRSAERWTFGLANSLWAEEFIAIGKRL